MAEARYCAAPGGVRSTTRLSETSAVTSSSSTVRCSRADAAPPRADLAGLPGSRRRAPVATHLDGAELDQVARQGRLGDVDAVSGEQVESSPWRADRCASSSWTTRAWRAVREVPTRQPRTVEDARQSGDERVELVASMTSGGASRMASGATALTMKPASVPAPRPRRHRIGELDRAQQAATSDARDARVPQGQDRSRSGLADGAAWARRPSRFDRAERRQPGGARERVAAEGRAVLARG